MCFPMLCTWWSRKHGGDSESEKERRKKSKSEKSKKEKERKRERSESLEAGEAREEGEDVL